MFGDAPFLLVLAGFGAGGVLFGVSWTVCTWKAGYGLLTGPLGLLVACNAAIWSGRLVNVRDIQSALGAFPEADAYLLVLFAVITGTLIGSIITVAATSTEISYGLHT